ncbi:asparagine synthase-related protein [Saccharothrix australiensis]|uniref:asparagine synthase-related protein n=1 Tax=Saccharothrix australiensis TaxID=2072 RepID=UPI001476F440|nr:asparagine synthase C-terminal domain-containing protein [Saccharothrix australiensis]
MPSPTRSRSDAGAAPGAGSSALYPTYSPPVSGDSVVGRAFSLDRLARYLSTPSISFEFHPVSPWPDVSLRRPFVPIGDQPWDEDRLREEFDAAVGRCLGPARRPAVLFSGGLDSTAVLHYTARRCAGAGATPVALVIDMVDDAGVRSSTVALRLLDDLGVDCEVYSLDGEEMEGWARPGPLPWSPTGPRIGGIPHILGRINALAGELGCDVVLTGDGSDELFGAPRFLGTRLVRRPRALLRYLRDAYDAGRWSALGVEALSAVAGLLPRAVSSRLYWACLWPELCEVTPTPALAEGHRRAVESWSANWLREQLANHTAHHRAWYRADAWDACFPIDDDMGNFSSGGVPERAPFLDPAFVRYGLGLDCGGRYHAGLGTEYHRRKGPVVSLYPPSARAALPKVKQLYGKALARHEDARLGGLDRCVELGLVDPDRVPEVRDVAVLGRLQAVEDWIRGAEERGAHAT